MALNTLKAGPKALAAIIVDVPQQAIQQSVIPDRMLGRTTAGVALVVNAGCVTAALAGGLLGQLVGLRWTVVVATAIIVLCVLPTALGSLRTQHDLAEGAAEQAGDRAIPGLTESGQWSERSSRRDWRW